jgi:hypothetical protein
MGYHSTFTGSITLDVNDEQGYGGDINDIKTIVLDNGAGNWGDAVSTDTYHPAYADQALRRPRKDETPDDNIIIVEFDDETDFYAGCELPAEMVSIVTALTDLDGVRVVDLHGARSGDDDDDYEVFTWINGTVHSSQDGPLTTTPIDPDAPVSPLVRDWAVVEFLQQAGATDRDLALVKIGKRLQDVEDTRVFTERELAALVGK